MVRRQQKDKKKWKKRSKVAQNKQISLIHLLLFPVELFTLFLALAPHDITADPQNPSSQQFWLSAWLTHDIWCTLSEGLMCEGARLQWLVNPDPCHLIVTGENTWGSWCTLHGDWWTLTPYPLTVTGEPWPPTLWLLLVKIPVAVGAHCMVTGEPWPIHFHCYWWKYL